MSAMIRTFIVGKPCDRVVHGGGQHDRVWGDASCRISTSSGAISGFLSVIPYLGVVLAIVPPVIAGMGQIGSEEIVVIIVTVVSLHLFAINVLYPKVIGRRLQLNPLAVTLALLFWGWLWGAMGLICGSAAYGGDEDRLRSTSTRCDPTPRGWANKEQRQPGAVRALNLIRACLEHCMYSVARSSMGIPLSSQLHHHRQQLRAGVRYGRGVDGLSDRERSTGGR